MFVGRLVTAFDMWGSERKPVTHEIKIVPSMYAYQRNGVKTYEIRKNDRDYWPGDIVEMTSPDNPCACLVRKIKSVLKESPFVKDGYVVLQLEQ